MDAVANNNLPEARAIPRWLGLVFAAAMVAITASGVWFYRSQRERIKIQSEQNLASIADLKIRQITKWRQDCLTAAEVFGEGLFVRQAVKKWFETPEDGGEKDLMAQFKFWRDHYGYDDVLLLDTNRHVRLSLSGKPYPISEAESVIIDTALTCVESSMSDLYIAAGVKSVRLSVGVPIHVHINGETNGPALNTGLFIFRMDAAQFLFPLVESWPIPSETAETLLVRREGDSVVFLNNLRHLADTALRLRIPLTRKGLPAAAAVLGVSGVVEGVDYRGVGVLAALKRVHDTPWFMVSKVDMDEALAGWRFRLLLISALIMGLLLALAGLAAAVWQRAGKRHAMALLEAEAARRESEARYYTTLMSVGDGVIAANARGQVELMNGTAEAMTGWSLRDAKGKPLSEVFNIVNEDTSLPAESPVDRVLRERRVVGLANHTLLISRDGTRRPIADSGAPVCTDGGQITGVVLVFSDQTQQRQAENEIKSLAFRMQALLAAVPEIIMEVDPDKKYTWANPAGYAFFGEDCIGKEAAYYFEGEQETYKEVAPLFKGDHSVFYVESWQRRKDGEKRLLAWWCRVLKNQSGDIIGALSTARDITEARRVEEQVAAEKERLRVTLHSIGDGVICSDTEGRITLLNQVAADLTGWTQVEAAGQPVEKVFCVVDEQTETPGANPVTRVLETGQTVNLGNDVKLLSRDGRSISVADSGAPIRGADGKLVGAVLVFRDTTEKQKLLAGMQLASKLDSIGLLAGGIAHDFNNLLGGIFGYIDMAQVSLEKGRLEEVTEALTRALSVFDRAKGLTGQLLAFSRGGLPMRKRTELAPLIERNVRFALSGANVACRFEGLQGLWACDCDPAQIGQVIDNVVINAQQSMPAGGVVTVEARNIGHNDARPKDLAPGGDYVEITIRDTGIGIPENILPRIFEPFFTTKTKGRGLGLSTCYFVVKQHGGFLDVESHSGKGTIVRIYLPAIKPDLGVTGPAVGATPLPSGEGKILVMDDEPNILNILKTALNMMGYTAVVTRDGYEALREFNKALQEGTPFRAVILDLIIPGSMGGVETVAEIRKQDPKIPIIAASGYSNDPVMGAPRSYGFSESMAKPFRMGDIGELLNRLLNSGK